MDTFAHFVLQGKKGKSTVDMPAYSNRLTCAYMFAIQQAGAAKKLLSALAVAIIRNSG